MKFQTIGLAVLIAVVSASATLFIAAAPAAPPAAAHATTKWEYMCVSEPAEAINTQAADTLNGLGQEGWELISVSRPSPQSVFTYYFKRPK